MRGAIIELAADARPLNDDDWGSDRQLEAENKFGEAVEQEFRSRGELEKLAAWERYALKATTEETISEALRLLGT